MSVQYEAVLAYGIEFSYDECEEILENHYDFPSEKYSGHPAEELALLAGIKESMVGNAWSGDVDFILGPKLDWDSDHDYASVTLNRDSNKRFVEFLDKIRDDYETLKPRWYLRSCVS